MVNFIDRREYFRITVDCEIDFHRINSDETYKARCSSLSGGGISFVTAEVLQIGDELEITIEPEHPITPAMRGHIKVIRVSALADQTFEIGASMMVLDDDN